MVRLKVGESYLLVSASELKFNITFRNSVFGFLNSLVFNFTIPGTDYNARLCGFPLHLNRLVKTKVTSSGYIELDSISISGTWEAAQTTEDFIELSFSFISDDFTAFVLNKKLPDLFNETITTTNIIDHQFVTALKKYPDTPYQFPSVYNPEFYGDKNPFFIGVINYFERFFVNKVSNSNTIIPMLYLPYIIQRIFNQAGYKVTGDIFEDEMFKSALLYNNYALDHLVTERFEGNLLDYTTPAAFAWYYPICENIFINLGNRYRETDGRYTLVSEANYQVKAIITHKPISTVQRIDYQIQLIHEDNNYNEEILGQKVYMFLPGDTGSQTNNFDISHNVLSDELGWLFIKMKYTDENGQPAIIQIVDFELEIIRLESPSVNIYQNSFNLKNHVSELDVLDFLDKFYKDFQVFPVFDNIAKTVTLLYFSQIIGKLQNLNLSQGLIRNTLKVEQNQFDGIEFAFNFSGNDSFKVNNNETPEIIDYLYFAFPSSEVWLPWPFFTTFFVASLNAFYQKVASEEDPITNFEVIGDKQLIHKIENADKKVELFFSPACMRNFFNTNYTALALPAVGGQGTSEAYKMKNTAPLRILFYAGYGVGVASVADAYPFATITKYDSLGNTVFPITWTAQQVALRYWSETIAWYRNRLKLEFTRNFTAKELAELSLHQKQMFQDAHILIEEAFAVIEGDLKEVQVKGWTV
jgi:hypothetical protein